MFEVEFYFIIKRGRGELRIMGWLYYGNCLKSFNSKSFGKSVIGVGSFVFCNGLLGYENK